MTWRISDAVGASRPAREAILLRTKEQLHPQRMMRENGEEDIDDAKVPAAQRRPAGITEICVFDDVAN